MNINKFKKGDTITRTKACSLFGDRSFIGKKLLFLGIANGCVICETKGILSDKRKVSLPLDTWENG